MGMLWTKLREYAERWRPNFMNYKYKSAALGDSEKQLITVLFYLKKRVA